MNNLLVKQFCEDYEDYLRDESKNIGSADYIAFPSCEEEIKSVLSDCFKEGIRVTVQGGRTGLAAGASPRGGLVMSLINMNKVLGSRKEGDRVFVNLQPGVVLLELNSQIKTKKIPGCEGYFFAPDPTETSATIGGMVSCNASGAKTYMYGPTRNYVNKLRMVLADGRVIALTRGEHFAKGLKAEFPCEDGSSLKVDLPTYNMPKVKNASGYYVAPDMDLVDLLIGSDGTLGVISEIEVELTKKPALIWGNSFLFTDEQSSLRFVDGARHIKGVAAMEFFDEGALNVLRDKKKSGSGFAELTEIPEDVTNIIYAEIHADSREDALAKLRAVSDVFEAAGGDLKRTWFSAGGSSLDRQKFFRHAVPESVNMLIAERKKTDPAITKLGSDMSVPDDKLFEIVDYYHKTIAENKLQSAAWGHVGNNHLHVNILPNNMDEYARAKAMFKDWAAKVTGFGGAVSAEHGVGKMKADFLTVMYGEEHIEEMRKLKAAFDPKWLLGVGNMFTQGRN